MRRPQALKRKALSCFQERFSALPAFLSVAPCRVNLIGEHTDYTGGTCLPFAGDRYVAIAGRKRKGRRVQLVSDQEKEEVSIALGKLGERRGDWGDYVRGLLQSLPFSLSEGMEGIVVSEIPLEAGLSSSAALCVALLHLFLKIEGRRLGWRERAQLCREAEHRGKGVPCGVLDMLTLLRAEKEHALWIDCETFQAKPVPLRLPSSLSLVVIQTGIARALAASAYEERVKEAKEAERLLREKSQRFSFRNGVAFVRKAEPILGALLARRALHIASENSRVVESVKALERGQFKKVGRLLNASHWSLSREYEVSLPIIDRLVEELQGLSGVLGVRLMGAGFGGSLLALMERRAMAGVEQWLRKRNEEEERFSLSAILVEAAPKARVFSIRHEKN